MLNNVLIYQQPLDIHKLRQPWVVLTSNSNYVKPELHPGNVIVRFHSYIAKLLTTDCHKWISCLAIATWWWHNHYTAKVFLQIENSSRGIIMIIQIILESCKPSMVCLNKLRFCIMWLLCMPTVGGAYYVYPGASHNRFEHSIGWVTVLKWHKLRCEQLPLNLTLCSRK